LARGALPCVIRKDAIRKDVIRNDVIRNDAILKPARMLAAILAATLAWGADAPSILTIRVAEGDGASYPTGSRATRGLTVLVTDETGRPVDGATVSFTLPAEGPGGVFSTGGRTEIAATHADGRAAVWGMHWNRTAGPFEIRITAAKGQARAGVISSQSLSNAPEAQAAAPQKAYAARGGHKLLWISLVIAGAAAAGVAGVAARQSSPATASSATIPLKIGTPTISLGPQ
jgi:hypothetical protein